MCDPGPRGSSSSFVVQGDELRLSNAGQLQLLLAVAARGAQFRTTVRGFSMAPFIHDQDVLTLTPLDGVAPHVGEVVAFVVPGGESLAVHRVIARAGRSFLLHGDHCVEADGLVSPENILARVTRVERRGRTMFFGLGTEARVIALLQRMNALTAVLRVGRWARRLGASRAINRAR
jgi:hypothetical protein